jgi:GTPase SAR1 family protein
METKSIICPFCCHKFAPDEADFRLTGSFETKAVKTRGRPRKTGPDKVVDERLLTYNLEILQMTQAEAKKNAIQLPAIRVGDKGVHISGEDTARRGFIQQATFIDSRGYKYVTEIRLCPHCHNTLPIGYGLRETLLISILGDARSGKSVFLTMLIHELENNPDLTSKLTFIGEAKARDIFTEQYQRPLLKEHMLVSSTKRKKIPPFAFNFWYRYKDEEGAVQETNLDIIFYDIAGEDLRDDAAIRKNGFNIRDSAGLVFLADPTNFANLKDLFRFSDDGLIDAVPKDNSNQAIFNTLYNYFIGHEKNKSPIPFALAVSKCDLFRYARFDFFDNKPENRVQNLLNGEAHKDAMNARATKALNQEIRELLVHVKEDALTNNALGCFAHVNCFAISSLGKKPATTQTVDPKTNETIETGHLDGAPAPFRVKEPFYWILMKNGLLNKFENGRYASTGSEAVLAEKKESGFVAWLKRIFRRN